MNTRKMPKYTRQMTTILPKSPYKAHFKLGQVVGTPTRPLIRYAYPSITMSTEDDVDKKLPIPLLKDSELSPFHSTIILDATC